MKRIGQLVLFALWTFARKLAEERKTFAEFSESDVLVRVFRYYSFFCGPRMIHDDVEIYRLNVDSKNVLHTVYS